MRATEVLRRYAAGERDFRNTNLRDQNFKNQDLSGADFRGADIRSTTFIGAKLKGCNFSEAKAGLSYCRTALLVLISWLLAAIAGFLTGLFGVLAALIFSNGSIDVVTGLTFLLLVALLGLLVLNGTNEITVIIAFIVVALFVVSVGNINASTGTAAVAFAGIITIPGTGAFAFTLAVVEAILFAFADTVPFVFAVAVLLAVLVASTVAIVFAAVVLVTSTVAIAFAVVIIIVSAYLGWRTLQGDLRDDWIRSVVIGWAAIGGTNFREADLSGTCFTQVRLKSTDLRWTNLDRTDWHRAKLLDRARVGGTILLDPKVRDLLVTHRGAGQFYVGCNLKGANLAGADLSNADLTEADISGATIQDASLERANMTKTQALGTQFAGAQLTGACLEAWNIDATTQLDGAICDYVYLLRNRQERRPSSGNFQPGEFTKLFE